MTETAAPARTGPWEIFRIFLGLGLTSFGGPVAHLGYFRRAFVARRGWLSEAAYADLVALCQFLPGPASSQTGFAIGLMRGGWAGAAAAWAGFTLPSALLLTAVAYGAGRLDDPVSLGVIAGLLEFIPYVGPVASAIPAMAVAFVDDPTQAIWVALLYFVVQQIEGVLLIPLIQRETVKLAPAATLFSIVGFGIVLGPVGIVLAAPLTVFGMVLVRQLWVPWVDSFSDVEKPGTEQTALR